MRVRSILLDVLAPYSHRIRARDRSPSQKRSGCQSWRMMNWWARSRPSKSFLKNPFLLKNPATLTLSTMWPPTFTRFIFLVFVFEWSSFCFSLFLFLCLCVGFSCLCFCVGGIWGPACWWMILDRLCSVVVFKFWLLLEVGIVLSFACRGVILLITEYNCSWTMAF